MYKHILLCLCCMGLMGVSPWGLPPEMSGPMDEMTAGLSALRTMRFSYRSTYQNTGLTELDKYYLDDNNRPKVMIKQRATPDVELGSVIYAASPESERFILEPQGAGRGYKTRSVWSEPMRMTTTTDGTHTTVRQGDPGSESLLVRNHIFDDEPLFSVHRFIDAWLRPPYPPRWDHSLKNPEGTSRQGRIFPASDPNADGKAGQASADDILLEGSIRGPNNQLTTEYFWRLSKRSGYLPYVVTFGLNRVYLDKWQKFSSPKGTIVLPMSIHWEMGDKGGLIIREQQIDIDPSSVKFESDVDEAFLALPKLTGNEVVSTDTAVREVGKVQMEELAARIQNQELEQTTSPKWLFLVAVYLCVGIVGVGIALSVAKRLWRGAAQ